MQIAIDSADGKGDRRNALTMLDLTWKRRRISPKVLAADANNTSGEFLCEVEDGTQRALYAGGEFHTAGGMPASIIAKVGRHELVDFR